MPVITDELELYNGAPQEMFYKSSQSYGGRRRRKVLVGGTIDEELIAKMDAQVAEEKLLGKKYYIMSTYLCVRDQPDSFYQYIMQRMCELAITRFEKYLEQYVPKNVPKEVAIITLRSILSSENIVHVINDPIGILVVNNYVGKLNLILFQCLLLFNMNENTSHLYKLRNNDPPKVTCTIEELQNTDLFAKHLFDNWLTKLGQTEPRDYYAEFYPMFFYLDKPTKGLDSFRLENLKQYSPRTPERTTITLFEIVAQFSLGQIINSYIDKIHFLGFSPVNIVADGILFSPFGFMFHDLVHGNEFRDEGPVIDRSKLKPHENKLQVNEELAAFYRYCEDLHNAAAKIDASDPKYSDLYRIQLVLFNELHEIAYSEFVDRNLLRLLSRIETSSQAFSKAEDLVDRNTLIRFSLERNDLKTLLPADIQSSKKVKEYLIGCYMRFFELLYQFKHGKQLENDIVENNADEIEPDVFTQKKPRIGGKRRSKRCRNGFRRKTKTKKCQNCRRTS